MLPINPAELTPHLRGEFSLEQPGGLRCVGVLTGDMPGHVLVDDVIRPTRALLYETTFGTIYLAGNWESQAVASMIAELRLKTEVMIGLWPGDERERLLPSATDYTGFVFDFYDHPPSAILTPLTQTIPADCELRLVDTRLFDALSERDDLLRQYGSAENALNVLIGCCLLHQGQNVCEAIAGPVIHGIREIGISTLDGYRRRGYATITSAALIQECARQGTQTYWNCNEQNAPSLALARRLGYQREQKYKLFYWKQTVHGGSH